MLDESRPHCVTEQSLGKQRDVSRIKETPRVVTLFESAIEVALAGIISAMTLVEITFELQTPLTAKQLADLAEFANTYGLRRFRHDEAHNLITFEYDASRLRQSQVVHALAGANIAVKGIVPQSGAEIIPA
jgi:hypothetical protein